MFNLVFAAGCPARGVTPIMLGDKLLHGAVRNDFRLSLGCRAQQFPSSFALPSVFHSDSVYVHVDAVPHWKRRVRLAIIFARYKCNGAAWHQFPDEDNAASPAFVSATADIKAQINLFKITMKWKGPAKHPGV